MKIENIFANKGKQAAKDAIVESICAIRDDIAVNTDAEENKTRAEAIKILAYAYSLI